MTFDCDAVLLDLDGTLVNSLASVERSWSRWLASHGLDPVEYLPKIHGRRALDSIQALVPHVDPFAETDRLSIMEAEDTEGVVAIAGAQEFVAALPEARWTVVTSGTRPVALARLRAGGFPVPARAVFGEDVANGKPSPDPFLLGAERLGVDPSRCVVFEDTRAGVRGAKAAGMRAVAVTALHDDAAEEADWVIGDFRLVKVTAGESVVLHFGT